MSNNNNNIQSALWTKENTKKLIELLEASPELWDTSSTMYRDRTKKNAATAKMEEYFGAPCSKIARKLHILRTQMNNEMRKIKKKKSGDGVDDVVFTSNWEFFSALKFMVGTMTCNKTQGSLELDDTQSQTETSPGETTETMSQIICAPSTSRTAPKGKGKKQTSNKEDDLLNRALIEMSKQNDDEQIFGDFVAAALRNLHSQTSKRKLKRKIQGIILEVTDYGEALFEGVTINNPKPNHLISDIGLLHIPSPSMSTSSSSQQDLLDISTSRCPSTASYYENFDHNLNDY